MLKANTADTEDISPKTSNPKNILPEDVTVALLYTTLNSMAAYKTAAANTKFGIRIRTGRTSGKRNSVEDVRTKKIVKLSGGMKRRVGIAQAMLNDPKVLILDEPTAGLDPGERIRFRNFLAATSKERIVLLSTHIVSDIEDIADHVMIMKDGEFNRIVSATEYDDLEELYVSIFMNEEADHEAI